MGISFKPSDAIAGGLFQDVDVTVIKSRACVYDYNGKVSPPSLAVHMTLALEDGTTEEQYYSVGALNRMAPAEATEGEPLTNLGDEGPYIVNAEGSTATGLSTSCNFHFFLAEAVGAGFPAEKLEDGNVSVFDGMVFHAIRKPQPKRDNMPDQTDAQKAKGPRSVLVPNKIVKYPWDTKTTGKAKTAAAAAGGGKASTDLNAVAFGTLQEVLGKSNGSITTENVRKLALLALFSNKSVSVPDRNKVVGMVTDAKWLEENQGPEAGYLFSDGTVIAAA